MIRLVVIAVSLVLAGCAGVPPVSTESLPGECRVDGPAVVAVGGRSNMPSPSVEPLSRYLTAVAQRGGEVSVVDTGADPHVLGGVDFATRAANSVAAEADRQETATRLRAGIESARAQAPGADPLRALDVAARQVHASSNEGVIVLMDSGLQTEGPLDFTRKGMLRADPEDLVVGLRQSGQLPDLSGIDVFLLGIGETSPPQESLDMASRTFLAEQWTAIVKAAGATCVGLDPRPLTGGSPAGAPPVHVVKVPRVDAIVPAGKVVLDGESVAFVSDSDQLRDPDFAKRQLASVARYLKDSGESVQLTGTTATDGTPSGRRELSERRAAAVKEILVELGVPSAQVATRGVGTDHPEHIKDVDARGRLIPAKAALNRTVILRVEPS